MSHASNPEVTFIDQPVPPRKMAVQFSIKTILLVTAIVAAILAALVAPPVMLFALVISFVALTVVLATATICARGWFRAFAIGAAVPNVVTYIVFLGGVQSPQQAIVALAVSLIASAGFGVLAAFTHGYLCKRNGKLPIPNIPLVKKWLTNE